MRRSTSALTIRKKEKKVSQMTEKEKKLLATLELVGKVLDHLIFVGVTILTIGLLFHFCL